jgi:hypothetical protein
MGAETKNRMSEIVSVDPDLMHGLFVSAEPASRCVLSWTTSKAAIR